MALEWFYVRGDHKEGPITSEQLRELVAAGRIGPTDLVWAEGMEQWKQARLVKGLFVMAEGSVGEGPPPVPPLPSLTAPRPTDTVTLDEGQPQVTSPGLGIRPLWIGLAVVFFFPLGFYLLKKQPVLGRDLRWWAIGLGWVVMGGWVVALYTGVFLLSLLPILVPVWLYIKRKNPTLTLRKLMHKGIQGTTKEVDESAQLPGKDMSQSDGDSLSPVASEPTDSEQGTSQNVLVWCIIFLPPLGLYLLWRDPLRRYKRAWWVGGCIWMLVFFLNIADRVNRSLVSTIPAIPIASNDEAPSSPTVAGPAGVLSHEKSKTDPANRVVGPTNGRISGKWGFIDRLGNLVLNGPFDHADSFSEGLAGVERDGKWGYIDRSGAWKISPRFKGCRAFRNGIAEAWNDDQSVGGEVVQVIDKFGNEVTPWSKQLKPFEARGKYGCKNSQGDVVILPQFDFPPTFTDGVAIVISSGAYALIDESGHFLVSFDKDYLIGGASPDLTKSDLIPFTRKSEFLWGFLDKTGKVAISPRYEYPSEFSEGLAAVSLGMSNRELERELRRLDERGAFVEPPRGVGYIDRDGKFVIPSQFDEGRAFREGLAAVKVADSGGKWGFIDKNGHLVIKPVFEKAPSGFQDGLASIEIDGLIGFIDRKGRVVIEPQFLAASDFSEGFAAVKFR